MKVMLLKPFLLAPTNGGDMSLIEYFGLFQTWEWEVQIEILLPRALMPAYERNFHAWGLVKSGEGYRVGNLDCRVQLLDQIDPHELKDQTTYEQHFLELLKSSDPDYAFAHYTDFFAVSSLMKWKPERSWIFQTDNEFPRLDRMKAFPSLFKDYSEIINFLVASDFMKNQVAKEFPKARVFELCNLIYLLEGDRKLEWEKNLRWLFVNPTEVKGVGFFLELAKALPDEEFMVLGNWDRKVESLGDFKNIEYLDSHSDMRQLFRKTRGLLMPSVWEEAFGRLPLEAMHFGLPVIASNRGALPKTLGSGGQSLPLELPLWIEAMQQFKRNQVEWREKAQARAEAYRTQRDQSFKEFRDLLEAESS